MSRAGFTPVAADIGRVLGRPVEIARAVRAGASSFHSSWRLDCDAGSFFLKTNSAAALDMFEAEAAGLAELRTAAAIRVPAVVSVGSNAEASWLVLEHLALQALAAGSAAMLGEQLAALHRVGAAHFGAARDNYIGTTPQANEPHTEWPLFFARRRLLPQLQLAAARGMESALVERGRQLAERLPAFFVGVRIGPSLLHGDLWSGNAAALADGTPVVFDPATYFGDREADLAMAELFGGFPEAFHAAYRHAWPPAEAYRQRRTLYNLYHVLNHYNLFGAGYLGQAKRMINSLLAELN